MSYFQSVYGAELSHKAVAVYMYLKDRANQSGQCWPGLRTIARELHLSVSTVKRGIRELEQGGFLERNARWRENGGRTSNQYQVL